MMLRFFLAALAAVVFSLPAAAGPTADPVHGYWLTENRKAIVEIAPCGAETCGRMVWIQNPADETGAPKRDEMNSDTAKRDRPICGLKLVGGLRHADAGSWAKGWLYNPRDGETYSAEIRQLTPSTLEVRGYVGISLLGRSQVWTRVGGDRGGCRIS